MTWRTEEGLTHSGVNSIVQTRDGYLWIGTYVGLARFDGVRFVHFSTANLPQLGPDRPRPTTATDPDFIRLANALPDP